MSILYITNRSVYSVLTVHWFHGGIEGLSWHFGYQVPHVIIYNRPYLELKIRFTVTKALSFTVLFSHWCQRSVVPLA